MSRRFSVELEHLLDGSVSASRGFTILAATSAMAGCVGVARNHPIADEIPAWTMALERRLQPWCPAECQWAVPFTATYRKHGEILVFVGVRHVFTPQNPTIRAIDAGFAALSPAIVIIEGPPTQLGEDPRPIVEHLRRRDTPEADEFTKGEPAYAATVALTRKIPFIGGEPTRAEQVQRLLKRGFTSQEMAFSYPLGGLSQSMRAGALTGVDDPKLSEFFASWAAAFADQCKLEPLSWQEFSARYRSLYGVELTSDPDPIARIEGEKQPPALESLRQSEMIARDEHLLATIEQLLASRKRVLVIYGASHWTTLSRALERRLGKPAIEPFVE